MLNFFKKAWAVILTAIGLVAFVIWYIRSGKQTQADAIKQVAAEKQLSEAYVKKLTDSGYALADKVQKKQQEIIAAKQEEVLARFHAAFGGKKS